MIRRDSNSMKAVLAWWHNLQPDPKAGNPGDRAAAARLRHAGGILEASMEAATIELCRAFGAGYQEMNNVALIAAVLADLRQDDSRQTIARALGGPDDVSRLCKPLRFQRILEATDADAQLTAFRRALALLKHSGHAADLAASLLEWNDPIRRDSRRQRWLYDYYHTNNPDPSTRPEATP
jgi:CRISPR type I-E-associated protein CasB/Cse2